MVCILQIFLHFPNAAVQRSMCVILAAKRNTVSKVMSIHDLARMQIHFRDRIDNTSFESYDNIGIYARQTE